MSTIIQTTFVLTGPLAGKTVRDSATECIDCDAEIPEARRWAAPGCQRCVKCASLHERKKGRPL